jgi:C-terminal processing protease CtpA/Prc
MAQGGNLAWKYVILENDFQNFYHYIIEHTDSFEIEYIDHNTTQRKSTTITGSSDPRLRTHWKNWYPIKDGVPLKIKFLKKPDVAIMTIKSFTRGRYKSYEQDFDKTIEQYFEEIGKKGIQNLIIDVRGNEGGNNPEKVFSYIAGKNNTGTDRESIILPDKNSFQGKVIVLANERSISAQETFVSIFQNNRRGLTIGQSTPGCFKGLCGGKKRTLVLPNSRHEIRIPLHATKRNYKHKVYFVEGEGFPPDIKVEEDIDDILNGKDSAMELAIGKLK